MAAEGDQQGAYGLLLWCWRYDVARKNASTTAVSQLISFALALARGHHDVAIEVADAGAAGAALAPEVPTVLCLVLRCRGLVDGEVIQPRGARRSGASLDRVMSWAAAGSTIGFVQPSAPGCGRSTMSIRVIVEFQARPGKRAELRTLLGDIAATHGPSAPGFLGSTVYETLDCDDGLVEIAEWESAEAQAEAVQNATASGIYASVVELVAAPFRATRIG